MVARVHAYLIAQKAPKCFFKEFFNTYWQVTTTDAFTFPEENLNRNTSLF